jgi:hypothetical protein
VVSLTADGREAIDRHWRRLETLRVKANAFPLAERTQEE